MIAMTLQDASAVQQVAQQANQQLAPWLPVFTFLLGQLFAIVLEWLRGVTAAQREREARRQARKEAIEDRRAEFDRQTLVDLQDAMGHMVRQAGVVHYATLRAFQQTGTWDSQLKANPSEEDIEADAKVRMLQVRVHDAQLRELVQAVRWAQARVLVSKTQEHSRRTLDELGEAFNEANARIGERLRDLY